MGSANAFVQYVITAYTDCAICVSALPTPTPTPTATPTPTPTATPTPTPTLAPGTTFVFTSCTTNSMILQTAYPPTGLSVGQILKTTSGDCYSYVGNYINYVAPSGYIVATVNEFTATTATTYTTCLECLTVTTPVNTYTEWTGKGGYSLNCPICQITDYGKPLTFYTTNVVTTLSTGDCIFQDSSLTTPISEDFIQYGNYIYSVDKNGFITQYCRLNGNCK
jgi:hypothetical protein